MADLSNFQVGQTVQLTDGRVCIIRFIGTAHFSPGDWIGVELDDGTGKNDGSVQGERYFECEQGNGMFLRPAGVSQVLAEPPKPAPKPSAKPAAKTNGTAVSKPRPSSGIVPATRRTSVMDPATKKRASVNLPSPTPSGRSSIAAGRTLRSPAKSPTKAPEPAPAAKTTASAARRTSTIASKPGIGRGVRTSMGPTSLNSTGGSRVSAQTPSTSKASSDNSRRLSTVRAPVRTGQGLGLRGLSSSKPTPTISSEPYSTDLQEDQRSEASKSPTKDKADASVGLRKQSTSPVLSRTSALNGTAVGSASTRRDSAASIGPASARPSNATTMNREIEDLKTKLRMMEKRRLEDRERLKGLEKLQTERDKFEGIIQKLQQKYQPQQQEINTLRKQLKEAQDLSESIETSQAEHESILEMATLDREMAEEQTESFRTQLEESKFKIEELSLEVEILRQENEELGKEMSPEEKTSQGWLQMERNNERLREALLRLRDITQEQESELRDQVKSLEEDVQEMSSVKEQFEAVKEKLGQSEASVDDLRQQLEAALGAEEMIEELTEKNMNMTERIEDLRAAVEDLESLQELNDELEINHIESEKQMQEEIDYKDSIIAEHGRKVIQQEETMVDYENTVTRFRELVTNLQADLEQMKTSQQMTENEAEELSNRSRAMMDLNMKLQVSAAKTQVKTIDLELRRLEAQESSEHLAIVQLFLPDSFHHDRDSVLAFLRFKRVAFKADLLHKFIKDRINSGPLTSGHEDDIFAACDVLDKLTWVNAMCDRFVATLASCSVEQFSKFEGALYELEPVERALNSWIEGLKREELSEKACGEELSRTIALLSHLAEIHVHQDSLESYAEESYMRALLTQSHLESGATALYHLKTMTQSKLTPTLRTIPEDDESTPTPDHNEEVHVFSMNLETLISHFRSAKVVVGKVVRGLDELKSRSLALDSGNLPAFSAAQNSAQNLTNYARRLGLALCSLFNEEGREKPVSFSEIESLFSRVRSSPLTDDNLEIDAIQTLNKNLRSLTDSLVDLGALTSDLSMFSEFTRPSPPWLTLSKEQKSATVASASIETALAKAQSALAARTTDLAIRNQSLDEASVKIELLESRTKDFAAKASRIAQLEGEVKEAKTREREAADALGKTDNQIRVLEAERGLLKIELEKRKRVASSNDAESIRKDALRSKATEAEVSALKSDLRSARNAISYLRKSTSLTSSQNVPEWLSTPISLSQANLSKAALQSSTSLLRQEASDSLDSLLSLVSSARPVQLRPRKKPAEWSGWRPLKETTKFVVARQSEDWEQWKEWADDIGSQWKDHTRSLHVHDGNKVKMTDPIARVTLPTGGLLKAEKENSGVPVKIVRPDDWDQIEGALR